MMVNLIPIPFLNTMLPVLIDLATTPVSDILRVSFISRVIFTWVPGLQGLLVLIKSPVDEKSEDVPLYSSFPSENVIGSRFIFRIEYLFPDSDMLLIFNYGIFSCIFSRLMASLHADMTRLFISSS